jgi:hypothetical protein
MMTKEKTKDLVERAAWTFAQVFIVTLILTPEPFSKVALIGAAGAALSALKTFVKETA